DAMLVRLARSGYTVVRLKGGDPGLFGRAAEELAACDRAGIPCEIVPGITAAVGAAAALRIPLTDRASAQRLQLITGHTRHGQAPEHIWAALADKSATTAVYMGTRTLAGMLPQILEAGADPATPAIAILSATCPDERVLTGVLRDLPDLISPEVGRDAPCLALFGEAMRSYTERQALLAAQDILARPNMLAGPDVIARPATQAEEEIVAARA
ncbi:MAG: SAM-dependent methyltransferase, partial [Pseudomonadota bacterium]